MKLLRPIAIAWLLLLLCGLTSCGGGFHLIHWSERQSYQCFERSLTEPENPALQPLEELLQIATKLSRDQPGQAVDLYLEVAERTLEDSTNIGDQARIYRYATGRALALMHPGHKRLPGKPSRYRVSYANGKNYFDPAQFDSITFADAYKVYNIEV